ncbi:PREDICTED: uncharacterized protein LOC109193649 [Ipomoea nil]|uniref:uncharacterized protein LOC109193649 n=1 Tax=Ipomoea nil TaxID=35883 RepID=UPI000900A29D|nr:PREDICTED: uncharacterized protein LOC109193649 [Ipomoea nil]
MEIEQITPQIVGKKLWNIVRIVFYMVRKGVSKSKLIHLNLQLALQLMLKRGKLAAGKALSHHYSALITCRSHHSVRVFTGHAPHDYEFSCSNTPAALFHHHASKRSRNHRRENKIDADVFQRVFEMLNDRPEAAVDGSPFTALPGFGRTPTVRQLRVTDSPFPLKDSEEINSQVDMDAEEFIRKFYTQLNLQSKKAALESPSPYHIRAR